jgi:uncharacterized phosphosugar-binding protein
MLGKGKEYLQIVAGLLKKIEETQATQIAQAADLMADAIVQGHALFAFGAVHSSLPISDVFIRAGGLALLNLIKAPAMNSVEFDPPMVWIGMERLEGYGSLIARNAHLKPGDALIVVSVSGRNPVSVEVAMTAREKGLKVIVVTSLPYSQSLPSRHSSGKKLYELGDVVIDCLSIPGDAVLEHASLPVRFCATSGVVDTAILQTLMAETIERSILRGYTPPVFIAGNLDGHEDYKMEFQRQLEANQARIFYTLFEEMY